ncbi:hypothetical protein SK128_004788 [Halocaridina rubra]|uniref:Uncharacterized protein n=1 Tax=Halocaridina rubra TaxID=373956 RepID=A0AAN8WKB3_HALRR
MIKSGTRNKRMTGKRKTRRLVEDGTTKLPSLWQNFISEDVNKVYLIRYLTKELLSRASKLPADKELVVAGGNIDPKIVVSSRRGDLAHLQKLCISENPTAGETEDGQSDDESDDEL